MKNKKKLKAAILIMTAIAIPFEIAANLTGIIPFINTLILTGCTKPSDPSTYPCFTQAFASSQLQDDQHGENHYTYNPEHVLDKSTKTAWNEGADGPGLQQWIRLGASTPQHVQGLSIKNGYPLNDNIYYANNRLKDITIELSDGYRMTAVLDDSYDKLQDIRFDSAHDIVWLIITIDSVYPGNEYDDTCISYIGAF